MESHQSLISSSKKSYTRIELQEVNGYTSEAPVEGSNGFFDSIKDNGTRGASTRGVRVIPWKGIVALLVSLLTMAGSSGLLFYLDWRRELVPTAGVYRVMQPASWISALMSVNSIALHVALMDGVTIAWWYCATRPTANLQQVHDIWYTGTSSFHAVIQLQKLSYVSLATLFVAVLPLNSFLLQAAITTPLTVIQKYSPIAVPMSRKLPSGYSGIRREDENGLEHIEQIGWDTNWGGVSQQVKNIAGSRYASYAYIGAYDQCDHGATICTDTYMSSESHPAEDHLLGLRYYYNDTQSVFSFRAQGAGFKIDCENYTAPYDMTYVEGQQNSHAIFLNIVGWEVSNPNVITVLMRWKADSRCNGEFEIRSCTLKAATVEYPVEMSLNMAEEYRGPYFSLPVNTTWEQDKIIEELPVYPHDNLIAINSSIKGPTTYGGIFNSFSEWYRSNLTWIINAVDSAEMERDGPLAFAMDPGYWDPYYGTVNSSEACQVSMAWGLSYVNYFEQMTKRDKQDAVEFGPLAWSDVGSPIDLVLNQIRQSMFLASIYEGAGYWSRSFIRYNGSNGTFERPVEDTDYIQHVVALRTKEVPAYRIRWHLLIASVVMNFCVILVIVPTFYGFCKLLLGSLPGE